jgi:hypothetical protein
LEKEEEQKKAAVDVDDKKRKYNSKNATNEVTEEEMEAYRREKRSM